jgi:hypothetical protein
MTVNWTDNPQQYTTTDAQLSYTTSCTIGLYVYNLPQASSSSTTLSSVTAWIEGRWPHKLRTQQAKAHVLALSHRKRMRSFLRPLRRDFTGLSRSSLMLESLTPRYENQMRPLMAPWLLSALSRFRSNL